MVFLQKHSDEIYWLRRRIQFLETVDRLLNDEALPEEASSIASQYKQVENPSNLVDRLRDIYGSELT